MKLTDNAKKIIKDSTELRAELIKHNDIAEWTLLRWMREDYAVLTTKDNVLLIEKYGKISESEILTGEKVHA